MKYLYFDTFSEINLSMVLGAFIDMALCEEKAKNIINDLSLPATLYTKDVFISSMQSKLAKVIYQGDEGEISKENILSLPFLEKASELTKERFKKFIDILCGFKNCESFKKEEYMSDFCTAIILFELFNYYKMDNFYVSKLFVSNAYLFDGKSFKEYSDSSFTEKIINSGFTIDKSDIPHEFTSKVVFSFLLSIKAKGENVNLGETYMTGYGAGSSEIKNMINILRLVYGKDTGIDTKLFENFEISSLKDNYYEIGYNKQKWCKPKTW